MSRRGPRLLVLAVVALMVAWVMASVPFSAPDEASHYLRAYTIASGHLLGRREPYNVPLSPAQTAWVNQSTREVRVPAAMSPPNVGCRDGGPDVSPRGCEEVTEVGNYQPLAYLLPAVGLALNSHAQTGLFTARFLSALPCAILLALAVLLLWDGSLISVLGLLLAISPMVFFVGSVLNPNGLEISASAALLAGLLALARERDGGAPVPASSRRGVASSRRLWVAVGLAAVLTVLAWQLGPVFLVIDALVGALAVGPRRLWGFVRDQRRGLLWLLGLALASAVAYVVYGQISDSTHLQVGITPIRLNLKLGYEQLAPVLRDSVGTFGSLTIHLPAAIDWIDWAVIVGLFAAALLVAPAADKLKLVLVMLGALAFPIVFYAWVYRFTGFGLQGRYTLPVLMVVPIYSGEVLYRALRTGRLRGRLAGSSAQTLAGIGVRLGCVYAGALQVVGWWVDARSVSGTHGLLPSSGTLWRPPLGWWPWMILAVAGGACIVAGGLLSQSIATGRPAAVE